MTRDWGRRPRLQQAKQRGRKVVEGTRSAKSDTEVPPTFLAEIDCCAAGTAAPTPETKQKWSFRTRTNRGQRPRLQREFLSQIEREFPVAVHVSAPDHDVDSMLNHIPVLFGIVAVTVTKIPRATHFRTTGLERYLSVLRTKH